MNLHLIGIVCLAVWLIMILATSSCFIAPFCREWRESAGPLEWFLVAWFIAVDLLYTAVCADLFLRISH